MPGNHSYEFLLQFLVVYAFYLISKKYTLQKIQTSEKSIRNNYKPTHSDTIIQSALVYAFLNSVCVCVFRQILPLPKESSRTLVPCVIKQEH